MAGPRVSAGLCRCFRLRLKVHLLRVYLRIPHKHPHLKGGQVLPRSIPSEHPMTLSSGDRGAECPFLSAHSLYDECAQALRDERPQPVRDGPHRAPGTDIHPGRHREGRAHRCR